MNWQQRGLCAHPSVTPGDFDNNLVDSRGRVDLERAREVATGMCGRCPIRIECLTLALDLSADGYPPQGLLWAGIWWPALNAEDPTPLNLLVDRDDHEEAAA